MSFILENWQSLLLAFLAFLGGLVALLKVVAPMTPTGADNKLLAVLEKVVAFLSGVVTPKMKPPIDSPE